ncbi:hypothetical protein JHW43_006835 [Diplocarpon mali]|nr:hypothetical protein JHW43_006835 [Diplocarpon mali]
MKEARDTTDTSGEEKPGLAIETLGQNFATVFQEKLGYVIDKARKAPNTFGQKVRAALASTSELIMNNPRAVAAIAASITICLTTLALPQQLSGFTCSFTAGSCFAVLQNAMMENYGTVVVINFVAILVATAGLFDAVGASLANTAATGIVIGKEKLVPAVGKGGEALANFGKEKLLPAMESAASVANEFGKEKLMPALAEAGQSINSFAQTHLGPAVGGAALAISPALGEFGKKLGPAMEQAGNYGKHILSAMADTVNWCKNNPGQTAVYAASAVTVLAPGIVSVPMLWAFGFAGTGITAGSAAAAFQSISGGIAAKSVFAFLQSAAMGGYGTFVVNGVVSALSAASLGIGGYIAHRNATSDGI